MKFEEKLRKQMLIKGFNQQKLAKASQVSDSEISRILTGKSSNPGVENALKIARAVGVSLDYLADDSWDEDQAAPADHPRGESSRTIGEPVSASPAATVPAEIEVVEAARELGPRQARRILETACELGYEVAIRRLLEMRPLIEADPHRAAKMPTVAVDRRA